MVYCGKASQGCQNCRTRRIKCDKIQPQCTQCVRIRKPCPGYRDQLSLMFRDESSKVMQKAHAQWGVTEPSELGDPSSTSPISTASSSSSPVGSTRSRSSGTPGSAQPSSPATSLSTNQRRRRSPEGPQLPAEITVTPGEKGIRFYIDNYILGLPDEPKSAKELQGLRWLHSCEMRNIMAAVGLAAMSNLSGDKALNTLAKHHYGQVLQTIASSMRNMATLDVEVVLRTVVIMAVYEVTRPRPQEEAVSPARTHVQGGAAILSNFLPLGRGPADGARGLLQLCFSMVAAKQSSFQYSSPEPNRVIPSSIEPQCDAVFPPMFSDWIAISQTMVTDADRPSADLIGVIARFVQLAGLVRTHAYYDGDPATTELINQALSIDNDLAAWEARHQNDGRGLWSVVEERGPSPSFFPANAVLDGCYHVYDNTYIARVWNHYRWARILTNQLLLESADRFPLSSGAAGLIAQERQRLCLATIARLARDVFVSVPTHYRHPSLTAEHWACLDKTKWGASIGIAGIPTLLFEVKVAACAPGVDEQQRRWALETIETVYRKTGMFQAQALAGFLRSEIERLAKASSPSSSSSLSGSLLEGMNSVSLLREGIAVGEEPGLYGGVRDNAAVINHVPVKVEVAGGGGGGFI